MRDVLGRKRKALIASGAVVSFIAVVLVGWWGGTHRGAQRIGEPPGSGHAPAAAQTTIAGQTPPHANAHPPSPEPADVPPKVGLPLASSYRDDLCRCETRACLYATAESYRGSIGLFVAQSPDDARSIDDAMRESTTCIQRIYAIEATPSAPPEEPPSEKSAGG